MIVKIGLMEVKWYLRTVKAHTGDTFVELGFTVLEILEDT